MKMIGHLFIKYKLKSTPKIQLKGYHVFYKFLSVILSIVCLYFVSLLLFWLNKKTMTLYNLILYSKKFVYHKDILEGIRFNTSI